jgi:hypothetical protein
MLRLFNSIAPNVDVYYFKSVVRLSPLVLRAQIGHTVPAQHGEERHLPHWNFKQRTSSSGSDTCLTGTSSRERPVLGATPALLELQAENVQFWERHLPHWNFKQRTSSSGSDTCLTGTSTTTNHKRITLGMEPDVHCEKPVNKLLSYGTAIRRS